MSARRIDGKAIAQAHRAATAEGVARLKAAGVTPGLAVVIVGDDPASRVYVRNKALACEAAGMRSHVHALPATATQAELLALVARLNADDGVHGILVQLPLPRAIDARAVIDAIAPGKDVDGFTCRSVGALIVGEPRFLPCTPLGVMKLLEHEGVSLESLHAVVVGRSLIVGKPMALMLIDAGATVTVCHSRTHDLGAITRQADVLVTAAGRVRLVTAGMVKPGAVVIDVGINRLEDGRLAGDVDYDGVSAIASRITPVPGGVGPMTIAMLLANTLKAAERAAAGRAVARTRTA